MKSLSKLLRSFLFQTLALIAASAYPQGSFQNLDFESAILPSLPAGQYGDYVSSLSGLPAWSVYLGTNQVTQVLQNNAALSSASVDILGPNWTASMGSGLNIKGVIEGSYSAVLQAGAYGFPLQYVDASISQVGLVPANAQSIQVKAYGGPLFVSFAGFNLPLITLATTPNYTLYGADISGFRGQSGALTLAASQPIFHYDTVEIDSIVFSIPEPTAFGLFSLGALLLGFFRRRNSSR